LGLLFLVPSLAAADIRHLEAIQTFDGGPEPAGAIPWVRATFDDFGKGGHGPVTLTFEALNLSGNEHLTGLYLNLDPQFDATKLALFPIEKHGAFNSPTITFGNDVFQPDGDGKFDIFFDFASAAGTDSFFGAGDWFSLRFGSDGLPITAASFDFPSAGDGSSGPFYMAARIEGIGPNNESAWIATPEPSSAFLALIAVLGLALAARSR